MDADLVEAGVVAQVQGLLEAGGHPSTSRSASSSWSVHSATAAAVPGRNGSARSRSMKTSRYPTPAPAVRFRGPAANLS